MLSHQHANYASKQMEERFFLVKDILLEYLFFFPDEIKSHVCYIS